MAEMAKNLTSLAGHLQTVKVKNKYLTHATSPPLTAVPAVLTTRPLLCVSFRTSEDGTPSVTFPRNFDRIVGLMGRHDLEDRFPGQESNDTDGKHGLNKKSGGPRKGDGKDQGKGKEQNERAPPWTKYLLEEGLDHTKTFSRYRGMFTGGKY